MTDRLQLFTIQIFGAGSDFLKIEIFSSFDMGENCYIVTDEKSGESLIIDPGHFDGELKEAVESKNIKYILLTHGHFDHIAGVARVKKITGAKICIAEEDEICLHDDDENLSYLAGNVPIEKTSADIILNEGDKIVIGDTVLSVMKTPGHSKGSVCYICEAERVIFSGDTLFKKTVGRTDFKTGDINEMYATLKRLVSLDGDYDVLSGHGPETTLDQERHGNLYIRRMYKHYPD